MKVTKTFGAAAIAVLIGSTASFANTVSVELSTFLQEIDLSNDAGSTATVESFVYSLGEAADGLATWDGITAGGTASDFLSDPRYFQTVTWDGLSLGAGESLVFSTLDIDTIVTLDPLEVTGFGLDEDGSTLANAFLTVNWSDGSSGTTALNQSAWATDQQLTVTSIAPSAVPLPAGMPLALFGLGILGAVSRRRRTA